MSAYFSIRIYQSWKKIERDYTLFIQYLASVFESIPSPHFYSASYATENYSYFINILYLFQCQLRQLIINIIHI